MSEQFDTADSFVAAGRGGAQGYQETGSYYGAAAGAGLAWLSYVATHEASGALVETSNVPAGELVPYLDPGNPLLLWHHRAAAILNSWPLALQAEAGAPLPGAPSIDAGFGGGATATQALAIRATGAFRLNANRTAPADCAVALKRARDQAAAVELVEAWLDAAALPREQRPSYDGVYFAELGTPWPQFRTNAPGNAAIPLDVGKNPMWFLKAAK